jgi:hypothetical protein
MRAQVVEEMRSRTSGHTLDKASLPDRILLSSGGLLVDDSLFFESKTLVATERVTVELSQI